jgi:hypothetical protein
LVAIGQANRRTGAREVEPIATETYFSKDFLSIKEFSEIVGISASTLRYYDKKDIFKPAKSGAGLENDYRFYSPTQITTMKIQLFIKSICVFAGKPMSQS